MEASSSISCARFNTNRLSRSSSRPSAGSSFLSVKGNKSTRNSTASFLCLHFCLLGGSSASYKPAYASVGTRCVGVYALKKFDAPVSHPDVEEDNVLIKVGDSPSPQNLGRRGLLIAFLSPVLLPLSTANARGLFQMPPFRLVNRYFLVRAGESEYERLGVINTNPVAKTSVDSGLSEEGKIQTAKAALELKKLGACEGDCWIWPSITQRSYQAAEIIAAVNGVTRSRIVPEYSFLDARGLGAYEGKSLESVREVYAADSISPNIKPPPINNGTPSESISDVFVRVTQLMSILETQYSGDTVVIVSPDSDNLSVLQAALLGLDLRRHWDLSFAPGEVRFVDAKSIPESRVPASAVFKCLNPPSCT